MAERWKCESYCRCGSREGHFEKSEDGTWMLASSVLPEMERLRDEIKHYRAALEEIEALASMVDEDSVYADRAYDALRFNESSAPQRPGVT